MLSLNRLALPTLLLALLLSACGAAPSESWSGVTLSESGATPTLYIANNTHLYALDPANGALRWQAPPKDERGFLEGLFSPSAGINLGAIHADPALADNLLILTSFNKSVYALNADSGELEWTFTGPTDRLIAPATVYENTVYVASADNFLYALDLEGKLKWKFETKAGLWGAALPTAERIYVPSLDHNLYAVDANGKQLWAASLNGALAGAPALSADQKIVFVGTLSDALYALDAATGQVRWTANADGWVWGAPLVVEDTVYFADFEGSVYSVNADEGETIWKTQIDGLVRGSPALASETLIIAADEGVVYALDPADGSKKWEKVIDDQNADRLLASPVIVDDLAVIVPLNADQLVYALSLDNGQVKWTFKP